MGAIEAVEYVALHVTNMFRRGLSRNEAIRELATNSATAKHEHSEKMSIAEWDYEIRDNRLYSAASQAFFSDIINPDPKTCPAGFIRLPPHAIANLLAMEKLIVSGDVTQLIVLSPASDYRVTENSEKGQIYSFRRVGNRVLSAALDVSEEAKMMMEQAETLFGKNPFIVNGANRVNGGGVYKTDRNGVPSRREVAELMEKMGDHKLALQYRTADTNASGLSVRDYIEKLIQKELVEIDKLIKASGVDLNDRDKCVEIAVAYVQRELAAIIKAQDFADGKAQELFTATENNRTTGETQGVRVNDPVTAQSAPYRSEWLAREIVEDYRNELFPPDTTSRSFIERQALPPDTNSVRYQVDPIYKMLHSSALEKCEQAVTSLTEASRSIADVVRVSSEPSNTNKSGFIRESFSATTFQNSPQSHSQTTPTGESITRASYLRSPDLKATPLSAKTQNSYGNNFSRSLQSRGHNSISQKSTGLTSAVSQSKKFTNSGQLRTNEVRAAYLLTAASQSPFKSSSQLRNRENFVKSNVELKSRSLRLVDPKLNSSSRGAVLTNSRESHSSRTALLSKLGLSKLSSTYSSVKRSISKSLSDLKLTLKNFPKTILKVTSRILSAPTRAFNRVAHQLRKILAVRLARYQTRQALRQIKVLRRVAAIARLKTRVRLAQTRERLLTKLKLFGVKNPFKRVVLRITLTTQHRVAQLKKTTLREFRLLKLLVRRPLANFKVIKRSLLLSPIQKLLNFIEQTRAALEAVLFQQLRNRLLRQQKSEQIDLSNIGDDDQTTDGVFLSDESDAQGLLSKEESTDAQSAQQPIDETESIVDLGTVVSETPTWELKTTTAMTVTSR